MEIKPLLQKIVEARRLIKGLAKSARNEHFKYDYVPAAAVVETVRAAVDQVGLVIFPTIVTLETTCQDKQITVKMTMIYTIVNAEDPSQSLQVPWAAIGLDSSERAIGKALSYAEKNFFLKFFLIPTTGEDVDAEEETEIWPPALPANISQEWPLEEIGYSKTGSLTWASAAADARMPDGSSARSYLHKLAAWRENPSIAAKAAAALALPRTPPAQ